MSKTYVGNNAKSIQTAPILTGYSKVHLDVSDTLWYEAGDNSGRTLTVSNPWGTQKMCNDILASVRGYQHQPFTSSGAIVDPAAELWDAVTIGDTYGGIGSMRTRFGTLMTADIESPGENTVDHEFPYTPKPDRKIERQFHDVRASILVNADAITAEVTARERDAKEIRATLAVQAGEISAKVSKTGGNTSFGWNMTDTAQVWNANGSEIFRLDRNGAKVTGEIRATSGTIGGFSIGTSDLRFNSQDWGGTNYNGIYLGTNGLQLGSWDGGVHISNNGDTTIGNLYAKNGQFDGTVRAGMIAYGGDYGKFNGSGIESGSIGNSRITPYDLTTSSMVSSIGASLANGNYANDVCTGSKTSSLIKATSIKFDGKTLGRSTITVNGVKHQVVIWV